VTLKPVTVDVEVECVCGEVYLKKGFTSGDLLVSKKCEACGEHMSLLDSSYIVDTTFSRFTSFTKDDLLNIFQKYGFCTTYYAKYGYKLKVESTENTES
jgi:hypothetical protein